MLLLLLLLLMLAIVQRVRRHPTRADVDKALNIEAGQQMPAHEPPKVLAVAGVAYLPLSGMDVAIRSDGDLVQAEAVILEPNISIRDHPAIDDVTVFTLGMYVTRHGLRIVVPPRPSYPRCQNGSI